MATNAPALSRASVQRPENWRDKYGRFEPKVGWELPFLDYYRKHGVIYMAAERAGVHHATVWRLQQDDPEFAAAMETAKQGYADSLQVRLVASGKKKENPVGYIVQLKAQRPDLYIERSLTMSVNADVQLEPEAGLQLIQALLGKATNATLAAAHLPHAAAQLPESSGAQRNGIITDDAKK